MKSSRAVVPLLVIVVLVAAALTAEWWMRRRAVPPGHVADIVTFLSWKPGVERFVVVNDGTAEHVIARAPGAGLFPSGPSAYVFDTGGKLVDWSADTGDDRPFVARWRVDEADRTGKSMGRAGLSSWLAGR
jgi:hypothetical protein